LEYLFPNTFTVSTEPDVTLIAQPSLGFTDPLPIEVTGDAAAGSIPEPSSLALFTVGLVVAAGVRSRSGGDACPL
jgi:hypothetical protein